MGKKITIAVKVKQKGTGSSVVQLYTVQCNKSDDCTVVSCPHMIPHKPEIIDNGYRCDQYKRKDIAKKTCANTKIKGAYCVSVDPK